MLDISMAFEVANSMFTFYKHVSFTNVYQIKNLIKKFRTEFVESFCYSKTKRHSKQTVVAFNFFLPHPNAK